MNIKNSFLVLGLLVVGQTVFGHSAEVVDRIARMRADLKEGAVNSNFTDEELLNGKKHLNNFQSPSAQAFMQRVVASQLNTVETGYINAYLDGYMMHCKTIHSEASCGRKIEAFAYLLNEKMLDDFEKTLNQDK